MTKDFFNNFIRSLFCSIDYYIYSSIEWVTQGIFDISELRTNVKIVSEVRNKLYVLLGILMLFKISATFINYMINPDQMSDREKGVKNLIERTIGMIALLIMLPTIFNFLYRTQKAFLPILPRVLLGKEQADVTKTVTENSNTMAVTVLQAFFHPYYEDDPKKEFPSIDGSKEIESLDDFVQHVNDVNPLENPLLGSNVDGYSYEYRFFVSTIVGLIVLGLLVSMTIDIAIRLFKLLVLEMLAPIPIISNIKPSSEKDSPFSNWLKEVLISFFDIFIKLGLIYLVLFFIVKLNENGLFVTWESAEGSKINPLRLMYLKVFLIVGLLIFAHQAPKFIRKIIGIKDGDEGSFLGSVAGGLAGFGSGLISGAISGQGLKGAISGGIAGANAGYNGTKNVWRNNAEPELGGRANNKSGILASLQNSASSAKIKSDASKLNVSDNSVESARATWQKAQSMALAAENNYKQLIAAGPQAGESDADYNNRRAAAYNDWQEKVKYSKETEVTYTQARESYSRGSSSSGGSVHRAAKRAGTGISNKSGSLSGQVASSDSVAKSTTAVVGEVTSNVSGETTIEARRNERTSNNN